MNRLPAQSLDMNSGRTGSNKNSAKRRRLLVWVLGLILFYTIFGFLILPLIVRAVAVKKLSQELDREVAIGTVKINPYALSTTIRGFLIKDKDGQPLVSWDEVYVNVQLSSFFGHAWVFKEISTTNPYVRVQVNKDYSLNVSDLITKFSTNAPSSSNASPAKPLALRIDRLHIARASASLTDLTPSTAFKRTLGPLDITLENFRTDPDNKNPYSFTGTTDAGEKISWSGYFFLDPIRSRGELSLENFGLNKYAALYQDFVRFEIRDGTADMRAAYELEFTPTNRIAIVTNASFALHSFKLGEPGNPTNIVELPEFAVADASADAIARRAEIESISGRGARLFVQRNKGSAINVVELSKPPATATNLPGGIMLLLESVTNVVAQLLNSTNQSVGVIREVNFHDCAVRLEDYVNSRPVALNLDDISLGATNISNLPGKNLTATLALRWNTNGTIRTDVAASFLPTTADVNIALDKLELRPLDPYLESKLNVFVVDSKLGMNGHVHLRTMTNTDLPEVTFNGDVWLNDFSTVDGMFGEDLLKWGSVRISGIEANLNPQTVVVREIAVDDAFARVVVETNRTINLLAALRIVNTNASAESATEKAEPAPPAERAPARGEAAKSKSLLPPDTTASLPKISVATIVLSNAQARFTDRSIEPSANISVQQASGTIKNISSDQRQPAELDLRAKVDGVGPVEISGAINPFSETATNEIVIRGRDIDLTPESPYAGKFAGYRIAKGKLNLALGYQLHGRNVKSTNLITLDRFTFGEKVNSPDATKLPVRLGVAILKDRNGRIVLDVPIEGSLDDPKFKLNKVIWRAVENILVKVATSPFSLLGALFGGRGEELNYQDFTPGSFALQPEGTNKLDSLLKGLYERPGLQLEIGGSINPKTDLDGLRRVALDRKIRLARWQSLRASDRAATTPEAISLTPDERSLFEKTLFDVAVQRGEIQMPGTQGMPTNQPTASANVAAKSRSNEAAKGATLMMRPEPSVMLALSAGGQTNGVPADPVEQALLEHISIGENDFAELAANRARTVRDYILQSGKVEAERIFLTESQSTGVKTNGSKVFLQLR